ncbi:hydantoinase B/oxoprolinase family protein [Parahaliea aestuarii]|uniref:Hydantoinase B/oxoprolinase family protein n=1 Tax=Parahaliea aestuarii TaxID=1852021 RepID=A0A5C8ZT00_9GAMM|nr:hydantoinase B/oxoprolinase family protein [Parahaliea aestuarii]TXS90587.1 hydantoinase B/oxoprolinase family protein [Parahaliea aestuarii]
MENHNVRVSEVDAVTLQVLQGQLSAAAEEMQITLLKSSYSSIVTESQDATSAIFDKHGATVAQAVAIPIHLGVLAELGKRFAASFPEGVARPGDVYVMNDPYAGGTHLPDLAVASPVFAGGELVAYVVTMTHHQDVGGSVPGSTAIKVFDHFAEGLRIPMCKLYDGGERNEALFAMMLSNTRTPSNMRGDLNAQISGCMTGAGRVVEMFEKWGAPVVNAAMQQLLDYAEKLTRLEIERIPDGQYHFTDYLDDDGSSPDAEPLPVVCCMTVKGSSLHFDFTGTADQVSTAINNVPYSAVSAVYYVVRTLTGDQAPNNDGGYRPVTCHMPEGSLINPRFPAPINARAVSLRRVVDVVLGVMAQAIPERMPAANCGQSSLIHVGTTRSATGERVVATVGGPWMGGMGARPGKDGVDVTDHDASNVFHLSVEVSEAELPIQFKTVQLWTDSGGAGKYRGGLGYHCEFTWLEGEGMATVRRDRHKFAPWGLDGGLPGPHCRTVLQPSDGDELPLMSKVQLVLKPGDTLKLWTTGSGGHGDPRERELDRVLDDVIDGKVSEEAAESLYGVHIDRTSIEGSSAQQLRPRRVANAG